MSNTELEQEMTETSTPVSTPEGQASIDVPPQESATVEPALPEAAVTDNSPAGEVSPPQEKAPKITVTHVGPEVVEPVPPRDLNLPNTAEIRRIRSLQVPIIVRLAHRVMPLGEILRLAPGAIIEFNKTVNENLDLMINNKLIGIGQAVKVSEKFGLKITGLASLDQMIRAMGGT